VSLIFVPVIIKIC